MNQNGPVTGKRCLAWSRIWIRWSLEKKKKEIDRGWDNNKEEKAG
jgi:hypothetical protein